MKVHQGRAAASALSLALLACATPPASPINQAHECLVSGVRISADFTSGGRHDCNVKGTEATLTVEPETLPINHSPWYAFRLDAETTTSITVVLEYAEATHRYHPHVSNSDGVWSRLDPQFVAIDPDGKRARLTLTPKAGQPIYVAAQPIETTEAAHAFMRETLPAGFSAVEYGRSIDGAPLIGYVAGDGPDLIVALTRQHPPEVTGAQAFRAFVKKITAEAPDAQAFRQGRRILLAPAPNPDGVARGHWRGNAAGKDLNRDWSAFSQPETQALAAFIEREAQGRQALVFLDFHSTNRSVIYAPPLDSRSPSIDWLSVLKARLDALPTPIPWSYSHTAANGVAKNWALDRLSAPGVTVELADTATPTETAAVGSAVAEALIAYAASRPGVSAPSRPAQGP